MASRSTAPATATWLSCHVFRSNEVRLWLSVMACNLGNVRRKSVLPKKIDQWSLTSLQQGQMRPGGRRVKHVRYYWLLLAESQGTRRLFGSMVRRMEALPVVAIAGHRHALEMDGLDNSGISRGGLAVHWVGPEDPKWKFWFIPTSYLR